MRNRNIVEIRVAIRQYKKLLVGLSVRKTGH